MVDSKSFDSSNKIKRKSRFDDPNPGKRQGFQDTQDNSINNQNNLQQNYNLQTGINFSNNFNNSNNNNNNLNLKNIPNIQTSHNIQGFQNDQNLQSSYSTQDLYNTQVFQGSHNLTGFNNQYNIQITQCQQGFQNIQTTQNFQNQQPINQNVEFQNQIQYPQPSIGYQQVPHYKEFSPQVNQTQQPFLNPQIGLTGQQLSIGLPNTNQPLILNQQPLGPPINLIGFPNQRPNHLKDKEDLDNCRVGIMASILIDHKNKTKEFVPYKPLDDLHEVPNKILDEPIVQVTLVQKNLIEDFYNELDELFDQYKNDIDPNDSKFNYSWRKKYNLNKQLNQPIKIITPDDMINPVKRDYYPPEVYSNTSKETSGLGSGEDLFESYRRKRSTKYHEHYAIREAVRKDPNCIVITPSDLCYSCNKPGHFAKDCKYGLT